MQDNTYASGITQMIECEPVWLFKHKQYPKLT